MNSFVFPSYELHYKNDLKATFMAVWYNIAYMLYCKLQCFNIKEHLSVNTWTEICEAILMQFN